MRVRQIISVENEFEGSTGVLEEIGKQKIFIILEYVTPNIIWKIKLGENIIAGGVSSGREFVEQDCNRAWKRYIETIKETQQ